MPTASQKAIYREMDADELRAEFEKYAPLTDDFEGDNEDLASAVIDWHRAGARVLIDKHYKQLTGESLFNNP